MNCAAPSLMKTSTPPGAPGTFLTVTDPTMKQFFSIALAVAVGIGFADYLRQGVHAGIQLIENQADNRQSGYDPGCPGV